MTVALIVVAVIIVFIGILLIRGAVFKPTVFPVAESESIDFDREAPVTALQKLIRCKTISYYDKDLEDDAEFERLIDLLSDLYPNVFRVCSFEKLPDRALLFRWKGQVSEYPSVMMAHYDVVPVEEHNWKKPPFEGIIEDGVLWGRGTLDTKATFNGVLYAADHLISKGFVPERDIYFAFSGGEEVNGKGAANIVDYFEEKGIELAFVLDEGGAVVEKVFPGVSIPCGLVGIAEKGSMNVTFSVESNGGHASAPLPQTPIGILSRACCKIEESPFPMHLTKPAAEMFDTLGRHSNFLYRVIFANIGLFKGVLDMLAKKSGGEMNALLRTTVAFTQASGSKAPNVIPPESSMTANIRINPEDTVDSVVERLRKIIDDDRVKITLGSNINPSRISTTDCDGWNKISAAVTENWPGCIVSPYLMVQCSDCRHYGRISDRVYRFAAMEMTAEERKSVHGNDERIRLESINKAVEFYIRLMSNC